MKILLLALIIMWGRHADSKRRRKQTLADNLACPEEKGWRRATFSGSFRNTCYKLVVRAVTPNVVRGLTWNDARAACQSPPNNGDLLRVESQDEMDFINELYARFVAPRQHLWIGLNDQQNENKFIWNDGSPLNRSMSNNWGKGEPNNHGGEHCVALYDSAWLDEDCSIEYGYICEKQSDVNECQTTKPCKNGGKCENVPGSYNCSCKTGYTGKDCEEDINECVTTKPCQNGGTCVNSFGSYSCSCKSGYTGKDCDEDVNECQTTKPCKHGGKCENVPGSYNCSCKTGYTGKNCEEDINECETTKPCQNGGTCVNSFGSYSCSCKSGYTGEDCDEDVNECQTTKPCKNGGKCENFPGSYNCSCKTGYTGKDCDEDINECVTTKPCQNGGTCVNSFGSYSCSCKSGFTGKDCDEDIDECSTSNPCLNEADCFNTPGSFHCICQPGFIGADCSEDIDECKTIKPCQNGGTCENRPGSYICHCTTGFVGKNCDEEFEYPLICSTGWRTYGKSCYKYQLSSTSISVNRKKWIDAKKECQKNGGHLVKIDSDDEQHFISVIQMITPYPSWIGLHDISKEGHFTWDYDNTVPNFTYWGKGEPNNVHYNEDCVAVRGRSLAGFWNDERCRTPNQYICEKNVGDWNPHGCYKGKRVLKTIFGTYRIKGKVDECIEEAEKLGLHVFGVGVKGKHTVCVTTKNKLPPKNGKYGKADEKGCTIERFGLPAGTKRNTYFVYTRINSN